MLRVEYLLSNPPTTAILGAAADILRLWHPLWGIQSQGYLRLRCGLCRPDVALALHEAFWSEYSWVWGPRHVQWAALPDGDLSRGKGRRLQERWFAVACWSGGHPGHGPRRCGRVMGMESVRILRRVHRRPALEPDLDRVWACLSGLSARYCPIG